jgi:signal transduction histidine kinase
MTAAAPDLDALAGAARRVTGSEASLVVLGDGPDARIAASSGVEAADLRLIEAGLGSRLEPVLRHNFNDVASAPIAVAGQPAGAIYIMRRSGSGFDNEDLLATFAAQAGLSLAIFARPPVDDEMLQTWAMLDRLVLSAHSFAELGRALRDVIGPQFGGALIGVMLADPQRYMLQMMSGAFGADDTTVASHRVSFFDHRSNSSRVFTTGLPYLSNASAGDPNIRQEYVDVFGIERIVTVPLGISGVLHIANPDRDFTLEDVERAMRLAPRIGTIVELAATLFRARNEQRIEQTICRVAVAVASGTSIHEILPEALEALREATDASVVAFVTDDDQPIVARSGDARPEQEQAVIDEASSEPGMRAYVVGPQKARDPGRAAFYVPVALDRQRLGTMAALRVRGEPFTRAERQSLMQMANVASLGYATERYQQQRAELARLQERQRLADTLHDDVAQILFAAQLSLDTLLQEEALDPELAQRIARARGLLIRGDTAIRTVIHRITPAPAADIATRIASAVSGVEEEFAIAVHLDIDERVAERGRYLWRTASDALVRAVREALVNAAKHAGPCRVSVSVRPNDEGLLLTVRDDGIGARPATAGHHHGLRSLQRLIHEQGGDLQVNRGEHGTVVTVSMRAGSEEDDVLRDEGDPRPPAQLGGPTALAV